MSLDRFGADVRRSAKKKKPLSRERPSPESSAQGADVVFGPCEAGTAQAVGTRTTSPTAKRTT